MVLKFWGTVVLCLSRAEQHHADEDLQPSGVLRRKKSLVSYSSVHNHYYK
jgi:hypothetical protein